VLLVFPAAKLVDLAATSFVFFSAAQALDARRRLMSY
jgi:hypothetical protein